MGLTVAKPGGGENCFSHHDGACHSARDDGLRDSARAGAECCHHPAASGP